MSRRAQTILIALVGLVVLIELVVRFVQPSLTSLQIVNGGATPIDNLVVSYGNSRVGVGTIPAGESANVRLSGSSKGTVTLSFTQAGNPMAGFQIADFDPRAMRRDGLKQVLHVMPNQVMKYMDEETSTTPLGRLGGRITDWLSAELDITR